MRGGADDGRATTPVTFTVPPACRTTQRYDRYGRATQRGDHAAVSYMHMHMCMHMCMSACTSHTVRTAVAAFTAAQVGPVYLVS